MQDSNQGRIDPPAEPEPAHGHNPDLRYRRVLLKISGESLAGDKGLGINMDACRNIAGEIREARMSGVQLCLVTGGGNIFRGISGAAHGMDRCSADHMGMLATVMNALAMQSALERSGVETRVQSAVPMTTICEPFIRRRAIRHMEKGRAVIFAAGTGNPFFTTDTGAALRASEMGCNALLKGTQVDGVYTADPKTHPEAQRLEKLGYMDVLSRDLKVMDATAVSMMRETQTPIIVFSMAKKGALMDVLTGRGVCSIIGDPQSRTGQVDKE